MKRFERIAAGTLLVIGAGSAYLAIEMGFGSVRVPGPGFLPFWLAASLAATAAVYLVLCLGPDPAARPLWDPGTWRRPALAAVVMLGFTLLMGGIGFFAATFLLYLAMAHPDRAGTVAHRRSGVGPGDARCVPPVRRPPQGPAAEGPPFLTVEYWPWMPFTGCCSGFALAVTPVNLLFCPDRGRPGHGRGGPARPGAGGHHLPAAAAHLRPGKPRHLHHHAGRASTTGPCTAARRPPSCSTSPARRPRWSPASTATRWPSKGRAGRGPGHGRHRVVHRRDARGDRPDLCRPAPVGFRR